MKKSEILLVIVLVLSASIIIVSRIDSTRFLSVLSGSMSPAINTGDLVIVAPTNPESIKVNDIIVFRNENKKVPTTHRVVEITDQGFVTKGDANENPDARIVEPDEVIGKFAFRIPFAGYLIHYARSKLGFLFLVLVPGIIIIISEVRNILKYTKEGKKKKVSHKIKKSAVYLLLILIFFSIQNGTSSYFSDTETSIGNAFAAWVEMPPPFRVNKWWSDTNFNKVENFDIVIHSKTNKVTATNPGGFYININVTIADLTINSMTITDTISNNIRPAGDFVQWPPKGGKPLHVYLNGDHSTGTDVTDKFEWTFNGQTLKVTLKSGESISGENLFITFHIRYAFIKTTMTEDEIARFPNKYVNSLEVRIDSQQMTDKATLTAYLKWVGSDSEDSPGYKDVNDPQSNLDSNSTDNSSNSTDNSTFNCTENWVCGDWTECINGTQTRNCTELNNCSTFFYKPAEIQECNSEDVTDCTEDWNCSDWSE